MGLHSYERTRVRENLRQEDADYLAEYARKVYEVRPDDFDVRAGGRLRQLEVFVGDDECSTIIYMIEPGDGYVRAADFAVDSFSSEGERQLYEFSVGCDTIRLVRDNGASYENVPLDDEEYSAAMQHIHEVLRASGVLPPVTTPQDETAFWQVALEICYDEIGDEAKHGVWEYVDNITPTKSFKEFAASTEKATNALRMALGTQALMGGFSARGALASELKNLYWHHVVCRKVDSLKR